MKQIKTNKTRNKNSLKHSDCFADVKMNVAFIRKHLPLSRHQSFVLPCDKMLTLSQLVCKFFFVFCIEKADRVPRGLRDGYFQILDPFSCASFILFFVLKRQTGYQEGSGMDIFRYSILSRVQVLYCFLYRKGRPGTKRVKGGYFQILDPMMRT